MSCSHPLKRLISDEPYSDDEKLLFSRLKYPRLDQECQKTKENLVFELLKDIAETDNEAYIETLSDEVILLVFLYLDLQTLCRCSSVCKKWYSLSTDNILWWNICKENRWTKAMKFGKLQQNWKKIARINFKNERKVLRNWNQRLGETFFLDLCIHSDTFLQSCLVHEGTLFCGYSDGNVNVWDLDSCSFITTLKPPQNFPFPPPPPPHQNAPEGLIDLWDDVEAAVAFTTSPYDCISFMDISGNLFATSNWNNNIHIFNLNQIQSPIVLTAPTPHVMITGLKLYSDLGLCVSSNSFGDVSVYSLEQKELVWNFSHHQSRIHRLEKLGNLCISAFIDGAIHLYPMHDFASFVQNQTTCSSKSHSLSDQQNLSTVTSFGSWLQNPVIGDDLEAIHADIETYQLVSGHHKGKLKLFDLHKCVLLESSVPFTSKVTALNRWEKNELIAGSEFGELILFDLRCGLHQHVARVQQNPSISCLQMNEYHLVVGAGFTTTVWDKRNLSTSLFPMWNSTELAPIRFLFFDKKKLVTAAWTRQSTLNYWGAISSPSGKSSIKIYDFSYDVLSDIYSVIDSDPESHRHFETPFFERLNKLLNEQSNNKNNNTNTNTNSDSSNCKNTNSE